LEGNCVSVFVTLKTFQKCDFFCQLKFDKLYLGCKD